MSETRSLFRIVHLLRKIDNRWSGIFSYIEGSITIPIISSELGNEWCDKKYQWSWDSNSLQLFKISRFDKDYEWSSCEINLILSNERDSIEHCVKDLDKIVDGLCELYKFLEKKKAACEVPVDLENKILTCL